MNKEKKNPYKFNEISNETACVGINGGTNDITIRDGYYEAFKGIKQQIIKTHKADTLVYPLVFCARHSVELGLKIILKSILFLCKCKGEKNFDLEAILRKIYTHDIILLNDKIKSKLNVDERLNEYYIPIERYLEDYTIDPEGDAFRYTNSTTNVPHMESKNIMHISINIFEDNYLRLNKLIDEFILVLDYFKSEYSLGICTKSLSRAQIIEISYLINNITSWKTNAEEIKEKFNITSNELNRAIKIIRSNPILSVNVGIEIKFPNIREESLIAYKEYVKKIRELDLLKNIEANKKISIIQSDFLSKITFEEITFLVACIQIDKQAGLFPEELNMIYKEHLKAYDTSDRIIHKLGSGRLNENLLRGLLACGQLSYHKILST